ncbi:hypothetical protein [Dyadobacter sp. CY323]|uniref:hypothetical protein n=1 Tax=Dyadobacter sp. CY323 TaxID=2907302 RepID=UPI001F27C8F0|nr:hypothetical protein [Dyadobacter sp. CY323]MCE6987474.1 hypothetical protein [Dyadobacter sp. CY323]
MQLIVKDDKLQKYRDHIQTGAELTGKDKELFERYFFAFSLLLDGLSERKVVETLMFSPAPIGNLSQSHAYNIVNGCQQIFGALDFGNAKKVAQRHIYAVRLEEMAHTMETMANDIIKRHKAPVFYEDGEPAGYNIDPDIQEQVATMLEKSANVRMKAAKLQGLLEKDKVENPNKFKVSPNIIFTDDIGALEMYREIEDSNYEDVTGNETEAGQSPDAAAGAES